MSKARHDARDRRSDGGAGVPALAVVGHPNKGKSSIVATLAERPDIAVGPIPGTTQRADRYRVEASGRVLYELVDTPGFERPRAALQWLTEHADDAADRPKVVAEFVEAFAGQERFAHECDLLRPIVEGAGVLYVVDGSVPWGGEYEAEMEVLRWTGQPRMALINPIGEADHVEAWRAPLRQYFDVVRVFDTLGAGFDKRAAILEAAAQLRDDWREPFREAIAVLTRRRDDRRRDAARAIAGTIAEMLGHTETKKLGPGADADAAKPRLVEAYRERMRKLERRGRSQVEAIYAHADVDRDERPTPGLDVDLFSTSHWTAFGLDRKQMIGMGVAGGAIAGGAVDASVGGASFLLGSAFGAAAGGASAWLGATRLEQTRVFNVPLGGKKLACGPVRSPNFPFVLLGRALYHHAAIAERSHADRDPLSLSDDDAPGRVLGGLSADDRRALAKLFRRVARPQRDPAAIDDLASKIDANLARSSGRPGE